MAATQDQPLAFDLDVPVRFHRGIQLVDDPDLAGGVDPADQVSVDGDCAILVDDNVRDRDYSNPPFESHK
jgi:hypothetical protein